MLTGRIFEQFFVICYGNWCRLASYNVLASQNFFPLFSLACLVIFSSFSSLWALGWILENGSGDCKFAGVVCYRESKSELMGVKITTLNQELNAILGLAI